MAEKPFWVSWSSEFLNGIPAQPEVHDLRGFEEVFGSYPQAVRTTGWQGKFLEASRGVELKCLKIKLGQCKRERELYFMAQTTDVGMVLLCMQVYIRKLITYASLR